MTQTLQPNTDQLRKTSDIALFMPLTKTQETSTSTTYYSIALAISVDNLPFQKIQ